MLMTFFVGYSPSIRQFYWYSGATVYVIPAILYLFLLGFLIRHFNKKQNLFQVLISGLLLFFITGSNENWMILGVITIILFFVNKILIKEKIKKISYFILIWTIVCASLMLLAPGTTHRISAEAGAVENAKLLPSLLLSFSHINIFIKDWFLNSGLLIAGIAIMLMSAKKGSNQNFFNSYSNIFCVLLFFLIIYIGGFILSYSLGHLKPIRMRGVMPNFFVATLLLLYIFYRLSHLEVMDKIRSKFSKNGIYTILIIALIIGISNSANIKNVYLDIFTGNAKKQAKENKWIINYIENSEKQELSIPRIKQHSKILYSFSVPTKPKGWGHWIVTEYFNKKTVVVDESQSIEEFMILKSGNFKEMNKKNNIAEYLYIGNEFSSTFLVPISKIYKSKDSSIIVEAKINISALNKNSKLVFESKPFWEGIAVSKLIDKQKNNAEINYEYKLPRSTNFNKEILKVYFYNPTNDTIQISNMKVKIKDN